MVQCICFDLVMANYELELVKNHSNQLFLYKNSIIEISKLYLIEMILFHPKKNLLHPKTSFIL